MGVGDSNRHLTLRGLVLIVAAGIGAASLGFACQALVTDARGRPDVLVVGDSLVAAAATDLTDLSPSRTDTAVLAGLGASPCDLWAGYRPSPPPGSGYLSFRNAVDSDRPKAVVLAFSGNPGVSAHACIRAATTAYSLAGILAAYRRSLESMGVYATARGARVFLSASPARNPGVPEGWTDGEQQGYNGDPAFNVMMSELASAHGWTYDTHAAAAISGPGMGWTMYLPCQPASGMTCIDGREQVRYGGPDAIHCDAPGSNGIGTPSDGSIRFAHGLLTEPLSTQGLRPLEETGSDSATVPRKHCSSPASTESRG